MRPLNEVASAAADTPPPRDFAAAIRSEGISIIAEYKRRSPSAGLISSGPDPASVAGAYQRGGARAMSVLTEPDHFAGSMADLTAAKAACSIPVIRKDFLIEPYQVFEARAAGADAVLLIVAAIEDRGQFAEMVRCVRDLGMTPLIEVHEPQELDVAFDVEPDIIGVNQRNLRTFAVDTELAVKMRSMIPSAVAVVAESGIKSRADIEELESSGIDGALIGESLMRAPDPEAALRSLLAP